ncbi:MAG: glycine zipper family protein [Methylotetracoccus sp.]|nr:glycine zipper family protein [Methylotetracoccus sp.]
MTLVMFLSGCYSYGGWQPTVDTYNNPNVQRLEQDKVECQALARQAGSTGTEAVQGGVAGGLIGAAAGAAIGAAVGSPGTGAAIGAASGGIGGATMQGIGGEDQFKRAYINCMRNRGHNVIN